MYMTAPWIHDHQTAKERKKRTKNRENLRSKRVLEFVSLAYVPIFVFLIRIMLLAKQWHGDGSECTETAAITLEVSPHPSTSPPFTDDHVI